MTRPPSSITTAIPSSFVKRDLKLTEDTGNGEAKLYIGRTNDLGSYNDFFDQWASSNTYKFDMDNLLGYLDAVRDEFGKTSKYKGVSTEMWQERVDEISYWRHGWEVDLTPYHDKYRVYIRSSGAAWTLMREVAIPVISELEVRREPDEEGTRVYLLLLTISSEKDGETVTVSVKEKRKWCRQKYGPRWFDVAKTEKSRRLREARDALANGNSKVVSSGSSSDTSGDLTFTEVDEDSDEDPGFDMPGLFD